MRILVAFLVCFLSLLAGPPAALAQSEAPDAGAIQNVIRGQLEAFQGEDGAKAWSYAAPNIQMIFPSPESFMAMVRQGYPPVYHPRRWKFGALETKDGQIAQDVELVGPDGDYWHALYTIARQLDGSWKITSCHLIKSEGSAA
jgi:hypothetical protein